jgi:hypothetical protein
MLSQTGSLYLCNKTRDRQENLLFLFELDRLKNQLTDT